MLNAHVIPRKLKGKADLNVVLEHQLVERVCESDSSLVRDLVILVNADDVPGTNLDEDFALVLRVASEHDHKLQVALSLRHQLLELVSRNQGPFTRLRFKQEIVAFVLVLTHLLLGDAMP